MSDIMGTEETAELRNSLFNNNLNNREDQNVK